MSDWLEDNLLTVIALVLVTGIGLAAVKAPSVAAIYPTFVGAVLGILGVHKGAETTADYLQKKVDNGKTQDDNPKENQS